MVKEGERRVKEVPCETPTYTEKYIFFLSFSRVPPRCARTPAYACPRVIGVKEERRSGLLIGTPPPSALLMAPGTVTLYLTVCFASPGITCGVRTAAPRRARRARPGELPDPRHGWRPCATWRGRGAASRRIGMDLVAAPVTAGLANARRGKARDGVSRASVKPGINLNRRHGDED